MYKKQLPKTFDGRIRNNVLINNNNNNKDYKRSRTAVVIDMRGMCLHSIPTPSIHLASISKLHISNNNLQIVRRTKRKLQQAKIITRHNWVRATKPKKALNKLKQTQLPTLLNLPLIRTTHTRRTPKLPTIPSRRHRKPHKTTNSKCQPKFPLPKRASVIHRPTDVPCRARYQLQQAYHIADIPRVSKEA